jgi:hypothetical protein
VLPANTDRYCEFFSCLTHLIHLTTIVCSYPPEYCEFSSKSSKCKKWLEETHPDLYKKFYSDSKLSSCFTQNRHSVLQRKLQTSIHSMNCGESQSILLTFPNLSATVLCHTLFASPSAALEDKLATLTVQQREALDKDLAKKEKKEEARGEKEKARIAASKVTIKRIERNKRKFITGVHGLEQFGKYRTRKTQSPDW